MCHDSYVRRDQVLILGLTAGVLLSACSSGAHSSALGAASSTAVAGSPIVLAGNGVATVYFGQVQSAAESGLNRILGGLVAQTRDMTGSCNIDAVDGWQTLTAYFHKGVFVGYATNGRSRTLGNFQTAMGLRLGDAITQARQLYGSAFQTSQAQGGSWAVTTPRGELIGNLNAEPNQSEPMPTITSIDAGDVGCPAVTP